MVFTLEVPGATPDGGFQGSSFTLRGLLLSRLIHARLAPCAVSFAALRLSGDIVKFEETGADKTPMSDAERFALAMSQVAGRRLKYSDLTGKDESPRHQTTGTGQAQPASF
jgi:hypothetical protein